MDRDHDLASLAPRPAETNGSLPVDELQPEIPTAPALPGTPTGEPGVRLVDGNLLYCDEWW